jgi:hypothetical protein
LSVSPQLAGSLSAHPAYLGPTLRREVAEGLYGPVAHRCGCPHTWIALAS